MTGGNRLARLRAMFARLRAQYGVDPGSARKVRAAVRPFGEGPIQDRLNRGMSESAWRRQRLAKMLQSSRKGLREAAKRDRSVIDDVARFRRGPTPGAPQHEHQYWYGDQKHDATFVKRMDFVRRISTKEGDAVADQAAQIMGLPTHRQRFYGEHGRELKRVSLKKMNPNALKIIAEHANQARRPKLAGRIEEFLRGPGPKRGKSYSNQWPKNAKWGDQPSGGR